MKKLISSPEKKTMGPKGGFSLVELMVTVAVIAALAAIAIPIYTNYTAVSRQKSADNVLEQFPILLETFRSENGQFPGAGALTTYQYIENNDGSVATNSIGGPTCTAPPCPLPDFIPKSSTAGVALYDYTLAVSNAGTAGESATFTAAPVAGRGAPLGNRVGTYQ